MLARAPMIKIFALTCLSLSACGSTTVKKPIYCEQEKEIRLTKEHPRVFVGERKIRLMSLKLAVKTNCDDNEAIIPRTATEAVDWLSVMLPADALSSIVSAQDKISYESSNYGYSLEDDIGDFIFKAWGLTENSAICRELAEKKRLVVPSDCAFELIQSLR